MKRLLCCALACATFACAGRSEETAAARGGLGPYQGVVAFHQRALGFQMAGNLRALNVHAGQMVKAGQRLAALDPTLEQSKLNELEANARAADAQLALLEAGARKEDLLAAKAQLRAAKAAEHTARLTADRDLRLAKAHVLPPSALDEAEGQLDETTAKREAAQAHLAELSAGARPQEIAAAKARRAEAHAAVDAERTWLGRFVLDAPSAGWVLETHHEPGEVLPAGAPVLTLADTRRPYVDVFVPQGELAGIRAGLPAAVRVDAAHAPFHGAIEWVGRALEFTPRYVFSPKERPRLVARVRVDLEDPKSELHAGVPAFATFQRRPAGSEAAETATAPEAHP